MNKFYGKVGYVKTSERLSEDGTPTGVWDPIVTERNYYGDISDVSYRWQPRNDSTNENFTVENKISIMADSYAEANFSAIKYVEYLGTLWTVKSAAIQRPRIILTLGGVYNGKTD